MEENKYINTGFAELDELLNGGMRRGDLVLISSRPAIGKTTLVMNILANAGIDSDKTCVFYSIDTPKEELAEKMLCAVSGVSFFKIRNGELTYSDLKNIHEAKSKIDKSRINILYSETLSDEEVIEECRKMKREQGLDLVVIDFCELMTTTDPEGEMSRSLMCGAIARRLNELAKELDIAVVLISQLSRDVEERADHRPILSDLRGGVSLEDNADTIVFIYNPDVYERDYSSRQGVIELIVAKNKHGENGIAKLKFVRECLKFENFNNKD